MTSSSTTPTSGADASARRLVVVSGAGRSGTSTMAGALKMLGLHVPQPEIRPNDANPRGYFEPKWVVEFHKRVLSEIGVKTNDARPDAWDVVHGDLSAVRSELDEWMGQQPEEPQVVVKDPRTFWLLDVWADVAAAHDQRLSSLTMLRHPAEVAGSRDLHYLKGAAAEERKARETGNVAGWVNVILVQEEHTRDVPRAYSRYSELITDWRQAMSRVRDQLGLTFTDDLDAGHRHEIDDFIDVTLRRSQLTWDDMDVQPALVDVAEATWEAVNALVDDPWSASAIDTLETARQEYAALHRHATALAADHHTAALKQARDEVRRKMRAKHRKELAALAERQDAARVSLPRRVVRRVRARSRRA